MRNVCLIIVLALFESAKAGAAACCGSCDTPWPQRTCGACVTNCCHCNEEATAAAAQTLAEVTKKAGDEDDKADEAAEIADESTEETESAADEADVAAAIEVSAAEKKAKKLKGKVKGKNITLSAKQKNRTTTAAEAAVVANEAAQDADQNDAVVDQVAQEADAAYDYGTTSQVHKAEKVATKGAEATEVDDTEATEAAEAADTVAVAETGHTVAVKETGKKVKSEANFSKSETRNEMNEKGTVENSKTQSNLFALDLPSWPFLAGLFSLVAFVGVQGFVLAPSIVALTYAVTQQITAGYAFGLALISHKKKTQRALRLQEPLMS